ncbi:MAG: cation diffusion facilitator family transporter [Cardiobacteriaceae bacterium]|nr:cation diffusion facilitator family transporter [Cardiobacteriaceae bacterium]
MSVPAAKVVLLGICGNIALALIKGTAGILGHSYALIADAIESSTDVFSSVLLFIGLRFAAHPPDENHPYGHGRAESLATFITVAFLVASAGIIAYKSVVHIITPHKIPAPFTLIVLLAVVITKEGLFRFFQRKSDEISNSALEAEAWHHHSDALTSMAAFLGISVSLVMGKGWESADDWAALVAAAIIFYNAWHIFRPALADIMDEDRHDAIHATIAAHIEALPQDVVLYESFVRKVGSHYIADVCLRVPSTWSIAQGCAVAEALRISVLTEVLQMSRLFVQLQCNDCPHADCLKSEVLIHSREQDNH